MKIAMMTNNYKPFVGGVPISIERLAKGLRGQGHEVCIFAPDYQDAEWEEGVIRYRSCEKTFQNGMVFPNVLDGRIRKEFSRREFDLIHVHQPMLAGNIAVYLSRKYRIPLVYTYHTRYEEYLHYIRPFGSRESFLRQGKKWMPHYLRAYIKNCSMVIAPSADLRNILLDQGIQAPVRVLPTGLEEDAFQEDQKAAAAIRESYAKGKPYLLCTVSRLEKEKNFYFLFRCIQKLKEEAGDVFRLLVIGDGAERQRLEAYAEKLGIGHMLEFVGSVKNREVKEYLAASDLFVFASKSETQGIVLAEAMAQGLPVVAVEAAGVRDILKDGENGFLSGESEEEFAGKVKALLSCPQERVRMGKEAKKTAQNYRMDGIAVQAEECYKMVLEERSRLEYGEKMREKNHTVSDLLHLFKVS